MADEGFEQTRERFIEMMGMVTQAEGMPRISGRLMGLLIFDGRPYSFSELATQLQVSRGSISSNARLLVERGMIERISKPGDRQDYFQMVSDPYDSILNGVGRRAQATSRNIRQIVGTLPQDRPDVASRLLGYASLYGAVADSLAMAVERLRAGAPEGTDRSE